MKVVKDELRELPLSLAEVMAGFPSPADDFLETSLNLHHYLVRNEPSTFLVRVKGDSMVGAGILSGDILVVDRSLSGGEGRIVIANVNGEMTVKRLRQERGEWYLQADNIRYSAIRIGGLSELSVWGVVVGVVRRVEGV